MSGSFVSRGGVSYNKNGEKDYVNLAMQYIIIINAEWQTGADQCTHLKGHCHEHRFKNLRGQKNHFTATGTYKYWSSFDKNCSASVMKLKKSSIIVIPALKIRN